MTRFLFLFLLIPVVNFAQQVPSSLNGTWLCTDLYINGKLQPRSGEVYKRTFTERSILHTKRDSLRNTSQRWNQVYRFISDSCFIAVSGNEYSATWLSNNFSPENQHCIKLLNDSQLILTSFEGTVPIERHFIKTTTEPVYVAEVKINGNSSIKPISPNRKPLVLRNTKDTTTFFTMNPWQDAEISFEFENDNETVYLYFSGHIHKATDSTVYISFSRKYYFNSANDETWEFSTTNDTIEEYPIGNLVGIETNTDKRDMWYFTGATFMVLGGTAALIVAPLAGIRFRDDFNIDRKRYYNVAVPGLGAFVTGACIAIFARNKKYYMQTEPLEKGRKVWTVVK
ncbi:MAG: hypothetical protein MUC87_03170 [Bacteroidia bacterium]|jgi:hypothetical protein|nr:hypothetical protein [Bacteroidia bacterium]